MSNEPIRSPKSIVIQDAIERDRRLDDGEYSIMLDLAKSVVNSAWYSDTKTKSTESYGIFNGTIKSERAAQRVVDTFRKEGWNCKVVYVYHSYAIEFYNPQKKSPWWWRFW